MSDNLNNNSKGGAFCLTNLALDAATSGGFTTASPVGTGFDYVIDGFSYNSAAQANVALTACAVQAVSTTCLYLLSIDADGTITTTKGTEVATADLTAGTAVLKWPELPADEAPIGAIKIATNASTTFTAGTTLTTAAGITDTYYNLFSMPTTPLTS